MSGAEFMPAPALSPLWADEVRHLVRHQNNPYHPPLRPAEMTWGNPEMPHHLRHACRAEVDTMTVAWGGSVPELVEVAS